MKFRNIKYFIKQGFVGLWKNRLMSLASICIVVASLTVFGVFVLLGLNLNYLVSQIEEQCEINVYLPKGTNRDTVRDIGSKLEEIDGVKEAELYTKEERFQKAKDQYDNEAAVISTLEEDNPLRDSYILRLHDISKASAVSDAAGKIAGVEEVKNRQDIVQKIVDISNFVRHASIWLVIALAIVAVFIISNTIKLGMFARRKEINIMKFVGATNWFIRWPFIVEGIVLGILGAAVSAVVVIWSYSALLPTLKDFMEPMLHIYEVPAVLNIVLISFASLGMGIGMVGSYTSIRKYLRV